MSEQPLLEYIDVYKSFGDNHVLRGVDLTVERGSVTTIIGRSGIGKSVLLKHAVGLLQPDRGEIRFEGRNMLELHQAERKELKKKFSYMFQQMALFSSMTTYENIALPLVEGTKLKRDQIHQRVMDIIDKLDIGDVAEMYPSQLSGGMSKRVALARALIDEPEVVFFDEPTTGLDPIRKSTVHHMIARYQKMFQFTAVMVSHDIPEVFEVSNKVALLENGRIVFSGTPEEIMSCENEVVCRFINGREESPVHAAG
ncbi:ATP-binding cassette domain-containing protein [Candidatus Sumerlaeota bacterium]|nr:ATP-binding cassette domain-containing protein [Candidatus Sumerlaeota bacterium]